MPELQIRKSGGASIVSIPKPILESLGLSVGSLVDLTVENQKIVLTPKSQESTLEELLAASPRRKLKIKPEDKDWLSSPAVGQELMAMV